jgi:glycosyltransferase involved in cell wall biosynthesis
MRVLHLVKTSVGAPWAWRQMRELARLGIEVHVALPPGGPLVPKYRAAGITVHPLDPDLPLRQPWRLGRALEAVRNLVSTVRPDVIHSHFVGTTLSMRLALARRAGPPRVFQVPGPLHLEHAPFRLADLNSADSMDYWIGSCKWTCDRYRSAGIPESRVFLSYYGTDLGASPRAANGRLRRELGIGPNAKLVGMIAFMYAPKYYLGQTRGLKGHEDLIDAMAICLRREPELRCVVIGGAWNNATGYERRVRRYARERCGDRIAFLGTRDDVPELYPDLDVTVHPSHSENVAGAAVESLLAGCPAIATSVGGLPDLVIDGDTGWLVPPRRPDLLARAILEVVGSPPEATKRTRRGQALARTLFDVRRTAREIAEIYREIRAAGSAYARFSPAPRASDSAEPALGQAGY